MTVPAAVTATRHPAPMVSAAAPDFVKRESELGAVVVTDKRVEPAEHKKFVASEIAKWTPIIKAAGVYAD